MGETLTPTRGKDWRERQQTGVVIRLPSGMVARVRGVQPDVLIRLGKIPDSLTPLIADLMDGKDQSDWKPESIADLQASADFMRLVCECGLLEPRIVDNPTADDEIAYDDLEHEDKEFLLGLVMLPLRRLEHFRDEQKSPVVGVGAPKRNRSKRQQPAAHRAVGGGNDGA